MKEHLIQEVQRQMLPYLNNAQLKQLKAVLEKALTGVTVHRASPAALRASEDRHDHALCYGQTAKRQAGTQKIHRVRCHNERRI